MGMDFTVLVGREVVVEEVMTEEVVAEEVVAEVTVVCWDVCVEVEDTEEVLVFCVISHLTGKGKYAMIDSWPRSLLPCDF